jgi:hypothetical protein
MPLSFSICAKTFALAASLNGGRGDFIDCDDFADHPFVIRFDKLLGVFTAGWLKVRSMLCCASWAKQREAEYENEKENENRRHVPLPPGGVPRSGGVRDAPRHRPSSADS